MPGIRKSFLATAGITLLSLYFIFNGIETLTNSTANQTHFIRKMYNLEVYLDNHSLLLFKFYPLVRSLSWLIIIALGLIQLVLGSLFLFFDDKHRRRIIVEVLVLQQVFQATIVHLPIVENSESFGTEMKHFLTNLMIAFGLVMVLGLRK